MGKPKIIIGDFNEKIRRESMYRPIIENNSLHSEYSYNLNGKILVIYAAARNIQKCDILIHKYLSKCECVIIGYL